jgi:UDP-N-acetylmuramoyl-tripeptide--D-alanyl-D-alanine ligase
LAAAAVAIRLGLDIRMIVDAALNLKPAPHRGEVLRLGEQVSLIDDSYNSNPVAVDAAIASLGMTAGRRRVAFLGDMLELGSTARDLHLETGRHIGKRADVIVGVGPLAHSILEGALEVGANPAHLHHFADSTQAGQEAENIVQEGDAVLVKGSRGVHMESVVQALQARFGAGNASD